MAYRGFGLIRMKNSTPVYLRDLNKQNQKSIMEGFEDLKERTEQQDKEIIVGYYLDTPKIEV